MKKFSFTICAAVLCLTLCSCGSDNTITYEQTPSVIYAENLYNDGDYAHFMEFCDTMSQNNDDKADRDNFFNYILIKASTVDSEEKSDEYGQMLDIISVCLDLPLTQGYVISGLESVYNGIDAKLTEQSKEYLLGVWERYDDTNLSGAKIEVYYNDDGKLESRFIDLPDGDATNFKINDIKWKNVQFANYKCFYLSDMMNSEITEKSYYQSQDKTVSSYRGATANINFDENTISIKYDTPQSVTVGGYQVWKKVIE